MNTDDRHVPLNCFRRGVGLSICGLAFGYLIASAIVGFHTGQLVQVTGIALMFLALTFGLLNFYLSFLRPLLYRHRRGSMDGYRFVSGVPAVGTLLVLIGNTFSYGAVIPALLGIVVLLLDTGGFPWFVIATWGDSSLWDA